MPKMPQDAFTVRDLFRLPYAYSLLSAIILLAFALICEYWATVYEIIYLARPTSVYVGDIVLDNIPVMDLSILIIDGAILFIVALTAFLLKHPRYILFTVKALALFIIVRALFTSLTHMGIYPGSIQPGAGFFDAIYMYLNMQTGFFFSGHTGMPFLLALIFWQYRNVRAVFLFVSFVAAVAVLFAHVHYSIDVLAAPFMAFGIFNIAQYLFRRDWELARAGVHNRLTSAQT